MSEFIARIRFGIALVAGWLAAMTPAGAVNYAWNSASDGSLNTAANWNPNSGTPSSNLADTANFNAGAFQTTLTQSADFLVQNINFNAGAAGYTWNAGAFSIVMGRNSTTNPNTLGTLTNSSGNAQIFNFTTGTLGINGTITNDASSPIIINGSVTPGHNVNSNTRNLSFTNAGAVYLNVDTSTLTGGALPGGNGNAAPWAGTSSSNNRARMFFNGTGTVYAGNIGTAYLGSIFLNGATSKLQLTGGSFAGVGATNGTSQMTIDGAGSGLELNALNGNNITVRRTNFNLANRTDTSSYHIRNIAGNNTLITGAANTQGDWNTIGTTDGNWNITSESPTGKLTITGGNLYPTAAGVTTTLQLSGAGNGQIDSYFTTWNASLMNVVKSGAGTWTFTNIPAAGALDSFGTAVLATPTAGQTSVFRGTMAVNAGTLEFKPLAAGNRIDLIADSSVAVADGAKLAITQFDTASPAVTSASSLTLGTAAGANLALTLAGTSIVPAATFASIAVNGTTNVTISSTLPITNPAPPTFPFQFPLMQYGSLTGFASFSLTALPPRVSATLDNNTVNSTIDLKVTALDSIRWNGNLSAQWNTTTQNWREINSGNPTTYIQPGANGESVTFNDDAVNNFNVMIPAATSLNPASITFDNSTIVYTIGSVDGTGNLSTNTITKNGTQTATIQPTGTLAISSLVLNGSGALVLNRATDLTIAGAVSGSGVLTKANTNTLTLSGNNTAFTGTINVPTGILKAGSATALGNGTAIIASGATLDVNNQIMTVSTANLTGTGVGGNGALINSGTTTSGLVQNIILSGDTTFSNSAVTSYNIGGYFGSGQNGTGSFQGNGHNLTLNILSELDIKNVGDMNVNNITVGGGGFFYLAGNTTLGPTTGSLILLNNGKLGFYGTGGINGADTTTGLIDKPIVVSASANGAQFQVYRGDIIIDSPILLNGNLSLEPYVRDNGTITMTLNGPITGPGSVQIHGNSNSTARFTAVALTSDGNTYAGTTVIGGGGGFDNISAANDRIVSVSIGNGGATGSIGAGNITITPAGSLVTSLLLNRTGTYTIPNNILLNGAASRIQQVSSGQATLSGVISGDGRIVVNDEVGSLTLSGANTYTGLTIVSAGRLIVANNTALGDVGTPTVGYVQLTDDPLGTSALVMSNNAVLSKAVIYFGLPRDANLAPHVFNQSGSNEITGILASDGVPNSIDKFYTIQSDSGNLNISGSIRQDHTGDLYLTLRGAGTGEVSGSIFQSTTNIFTGAAVSGNVWHVIKEDAGVWTLSGSNNYSGTTTVLAGTLALGATGSIANSPLVTANAIFNTSAVAGGYTIPDGQTITGTGSVVGALNLGGAASRVIAPGNGTGTVGSGDASTVGTLTTGNLSLTGGGTLKFDLDSIPTGVNDKIVVQGNLSLTGTTTLAVNRYSAAATLANGAYRLFDYTGTLTGFNAATSFAISGVGSGVRRQYAFSDATANQLNLVISGTGGPSANLTWLGGLSANAWDVVATVNWTGAADSDNRFFAGDSVSFDDVGSNAPSINVVGVVAPNAVAFANSAGHPYTLIGGAISADGDFTVGGGGNVTFQNSTLNVAGNFTVNGGGNVMIATGGFSAPTSFTVAGTGTVTIANTGTLALPANIALVSGTLALKRNDASPLTVANVFSGGGALVKDGTNTVVMTGANLAFDGPIHVLDGILRVGDPAALGTFVNGTYVAGGTLDLNARKMLAETVSIQGAGVAGQIGALVDMSGSGTAAANRAQVLGIILTGDASVGSAANTYPFVSGAGAFLHGNNFSLTVNGLGEWDFYDCGETHLANVTLNDSVTYFGTTTTLGDQPGVITLHNNGGLGLDNTVPVSKSILVAAGGSNIGLVTAFNNNNTVNSQVTISLGATLDATVYSSTNNQNRVLTFTGKMTGHGGLNVHLTANATASRVGTVELTSNDNDYLGPTVIGGGGGPYSGSAANDRITLSIGNGGVTGSVGAGTITVHAPGRLLFNRNDAYSLANAISGTGTLVTAAAGGDVTLTGANTYTGVTSVNAGTLRINGNSGGATGAVDVATGATLRGTGTVGGAVTINSGGTIRAGNSIGTLTLNSTLGVAAGGSIVIEIGGGIPSTGTPGSSTTGTLPNPTSNNYLNILGVATIDGATNIVVDALAATLDAVPYSYQVGQSASTTPFSITNPAQFTFNVPIVDGSASLTGNASGAIFLSFTPVPEPAALGGLAMLMLLAWRRLGRGNAV